MQGRVCSCNKEYGYCFIKDKATGNHYFCHFSNTDDGELDNGYLVDFIVSYDWKNDKVQAKNVKVIESWSRVSR